MSAVTGSGESVRMVSVDGLSVDIGHTTLLDGVSLELRSGQMHGVVGETGSGKTMTARAMTGLLPDSAKITAGSIRFGDLDLATLDDAGFQRIRGCEISMIFQNPRTALHPLLSIQDQMGNVLEAHFDFDKQARFERIIRYLTLAGIPDAERVARAYPHELSGGLAQRVVIATALVCEPNVVIADEPTTGLDATVQRQILDQIATLQRELSLSVLMITHDLAIVAQYCDTVSVMNTGRVVEEGTMREVLTTPKHPYTQQLLAASRLEDFNAAAA